MKLTTEDMDKLGDTCKSFEKQWAGLTLDENDYVLVRLDGKSFHTFTKGLARPYDSRLSQAMIDTMNFLIEKICFHPDFLRIAYQWLESTSGRNCYRS